MIESVDYCLNKATEAVIADHLSRCDANFVPPLSSRVEIKDYAKKIALNAERFEAWVDGDLVGFVATYCNDRENLIAYITSVSVLQGWQDKGIASQLIARCIAHIKERQFVLIELEVDHMNASAIRLYEKLGFNLNRVDDQTAIMHLHTKKGSINEQQA